ncbi:MAG: hypothetical protein QE272_11495 [Nevskia sp.]|nr:hypothetical protein [Nevskia sp.]
MKLTKATAPGVVRDMGFIYEDGTRFQVGWADEMGSYYRYFRTRAEAEGAAGIESDPDRLPDPPVEPRPTLPRLNHPKGVLGYLNTSAVAGKFPSFELDPVNGDYLHIVLADGHTLCAWLANVLCFSRTWRSDPELREAMRLEETMPQVRNSDRSARIPGELQWFWVAGDTLTIRGKEKSIVLPLAEVHDFVDGWYRDFDALNELLMPFGQRVLHPGVIGSRVSDNLGNALSWD